MQRLFNISICRGGA